MFSLGHFSPEPRTKFSSGYPGLLALHVVMRALLRENAEKDSSDVFKVRKRSLTRRGENDLQRRNGVFQALSGDSSFAR